MRLGKFAFVVLLLAGFLLLRYPAGVEAQVNTVNLSGTVFDPQQLAVKDAKITLRNNANGAERARSDQRLKRTVRDYRNPSGNLFADSRGTGLGTFERRIPKLALGTTPEYNPHLQLKTANGEHQCGGCARSCGNNKD